MDASPSAARPRIPRLWFAVAGVVLAGAALAILWLRGSGDAPHKLTWPLVELVGSALDGEPPTVGLRVQRATGAPPHREVALVPVPGRPHVFEATGAPDGRYLVNMPDGWGMMFVNQLPLLQPGGNPARVRVGRDHTIQAFSGAGGRALGTEWGVRRLEAHGALGASVLVKVEPDADDVVLLRWPAEEWHGDVSLQGRFADGGLTDVMQISFIARPSPLYREFPP